MNIWHCRKVLPDSILTMMKWLTQCALNWLQYLRKTLRLTFAEGVALLQVGTSMSN